MRRRSARELSSFLVTKRRIWSAYICNARLCSRLWQSQVWIGLDLLPTSLDRQLEKSSTCMLQLSAYSDVIETGKLSASCYIAWFCGADSSWKHSLKSLAMLVVLRPMVYTVLSWTKGNFLAGLGALCKKSKTTFRQRYSLSWYRMCVQNLCSRVLTLFKWLLALAVHNLRIVCKGAPIEPKR